MERPTGKCLETDANLVGRWVADRIGGEWVPGCGQAIGLRDLSGELIAGVIFEGWNGTSVRMHVAAVPGRRWLNRAYLHTCFWYAFEQLGCKTVIGLVPESNMDARRFDEHLGFRPKATLEDCHPDGSLIIYTMTKAECRWLSMRVPDGQTEGSPAT